MKSLNKPCDWLFVSICWPCDLLVTWPGCTLPPTQCLLLQPLKGSELEITEVSNAWTHRILLYRKYQHHRQSLVAPSSGWPLEGVSVCLSVLHLVHILPSKSGPVFSCRPDMPPVSHVHTKKRVPLSSGHLVWTISASLAGFKRGFHSEASTYLLFNDRSTPSALYLATFSPPPSCFYTFIVSVCPPPLLMHMPQRGFTYTLHAQTVAQFATSCTGLWSQIRAGVHVGLSMGVQLLKLTAVPGGACWLWDGSSSMEGVSCL